MHNFVDSVMLLNNNGLARDKDGQKIAIIALPHNHRVTRHTKTFQVFAQQRRFLPTKVIKHVLRFNCLNELVDKPADRAKGLSIWLQFREV